MSPCRPPVFLITWRADYDAFYYRKLSKRARRLYLFRSEYIFDLETAVIAERPQIGHAPSNERGLTKKRMPTVMNRRHFRTIKHYVTYSPGTGKSHLAQASGQAVITQGFWVIYREAHVRLEEIADAVLDGKRKEHMELLATVPLLIIDDLGMREVGPTAAEELLEIVMRRHPARRDQHAAHFQPPRGGLGETARRQRRGHCHAGPPAPPRPHPQVRTEELENEVAGGARKTAESNDLNHGAFEEMRLRPSKRDFLALRAGNGSLSRNLGKSPCLGRPTGAKNSLFRAISIGRFWGNHRGAEPGGGEYEQTHHVERGEP